MNSYSVAIRTLGTSLETLRRELESLHKQTVPPEKIVIYIAEGYKIPDFRIGREEYVFVKKGMVSQRALLYDEISSDCILMLDDDVELAPDSAEKLLRQMQEANADCMAVDVFKNHLMTSGCKIKAFVVSWVFPRFDQKWGLKLHNNGCFSYLNNPEKDYYPSMSGSGPASLWRKETFLKMNYKVETWLDDLGFPYGEDDITFYKLFINGGRLFISFNSGITNLDGQASSGGFKKSNKRLYIRAFSNISRWHRMYYKPSRGYRKILAQISFLFKQLWLLGVHSGLSIISLSISPVKNFLKGNIDGYKFIKSSTYKNLPSYIINNL